jgi:hypothetical protein
MPVATPERRYSSATCVGAEKRRIAGNPDPDHISTSFVERQNLTMCMSMRRFTRLADGFSKKIENHARAVALHAMDYNFVRIHQTLKISPAMAAGVTDRLWDMTELVEMMEAFEVRERPHNQTDPLPPFVNSGPPKSPVMYRNLLHRVGHPGFWWRLVHGFIVNLDPCIVQRLTQQQKLVMALTNDPRRHFPGMRKCIDR